MSATKSNGIVFSMPFWDDVFNEIKMDYQSIQTSSYHIDALASFFVSRPQIFDVRGKSSTIEVADKICELLKKL